MEQVRNEQTIYSAAVYCRLSKDDEQAGESVSIETQLQLLRDYVSEHSDLSVFDNYSEGYVLGVGAKVFTIAGPVILYGVSASVLYGVIYWICR